MNYQRLACAVLCAALLSGCSSMRTIQPATAPDQPAFGAVEAGDTVRIRLRSGERLEFEVEQIQGSTIVAKGGTRFSREDIVQLQRASFSHVKTWSLVGSITGLVICFAITLSQAAIFPG